VVFLNPFGSTARFVVFAAFFHFGKKSLQVRVGFSHNAPRAML
jgi:hypothetical protein